MNYYGFIRRDRPCFQTHDPFVVPCVEIIDKCSKEDQKRYGYLKNVSTFRVSKLYEFTTDYGLTIQELLSREPTCVDAMAYLDYETKYGTARKQLDCLVTMSDEKRQKITNLINILEHPHYVICQGKDSNILARELVAYVLKEAPSPKTELQKNFVENIHRTGSTTPPYDIRTVFELQNLCDVPGKWLMCIPEDVSFYGYPTEIETLFVRLKMLPAKQCDLVTRMLVDEGGE